MAKFTSETAREMGRKGGKSKVHKLTLARVEAEFGPLQTLTDAQRRLDRLSVWAASGLMAGSVAAAAVRAHEVWLKTREAEATFEAIEELRATTKALRVERDALQVSVEQLEKELAQARRAS